MMKKTLGALCVVALLGPLATSPSNATAAEADAPVIIKVQTLGRGADISVPHLKGHTVVDGDLRIRVKAETAFLLGASGDGYVVDIFRAGTYRTVRVAPNSPQRTLIKGSSDQSLLSDDGATLAVIADAARRARIDIRSTSDGALLASRTFGTYPDLLDLDGDHLVVASFEKGAVDYNWKHDTRRRITEKPAYEADLGSNRLAFYTGDPYLDGCSVVAPLSRPGRTLWRSCRERVAQFSPNGRRLLTVHLLADGPGPNQVWERRTDGRLLASYRVRGFFGQIGWESARELLIEAYGRRKGATVRCSEGACERATAVRRAPTP